MIKELKSDNEHKLVKNIEIVIDVFKKAGEKVAQIGERGWKEVIN